MSAHCKTLNYEVETEPNVQLENGTLFKPDLAIHKGGSNTIIVDIGINWEGNISLGLSYSAKKAVYNNEKFLSAARKRWLNRTINVFPIVIGDRGVWPRAKDPTEKAINIPPHVKATCVNIVIKWAATIHLTFRKLVWSHSNNQRRPPDLRRKRQQCGYSEHMTGVQPELIVTFYLYTTVSLSFRPLYTTCYL